MNPIAIAAVITAIAAVASAGVSYYGQQVSADAQKQQEKLRKRQMNLEAARQRRQVAREAAQQRAIALTQGVAQGGQGSSGVAGSLADIGNVGNQNILGINQGQQIGSQMFSANVQEARGDSISATGAAIGSLGDKVANSLTLYGNIGQPAR